MRDWDFSRMQYLPGGWVATVIPKGSYPLLLFVLVQGLGTVHKLWRHCDNRRGILHTPDYAGNTFSKNTSHDA